MRFDLALPPLVVLLLLAFLWLVLLVLLLWFAFRPRRGADNPEVEVDKARYRGRNELATRRAEQRRTRPPQTPPPQTTERAATPAEAETDLHDDFDNFNHPRTRRDDFDF